jgi:2-oxoglutarate ferredoxin oxidoreductase subunit alpha
MERTSIKISGQSGKGLLSSGMIITRALRDMGFHLTSEREYPSLIEGGHSNVQIDFGTKKINSLTEEVDVVVALDRSGLLTHIDNIKKGGILIHGYERHEMIPELKKRAKKRNIKVLYLPGREIAKKQGGSVLMVNMVLLGLLWKVLGFNPDELEGEVKQQFASKPKLLKIDLKCIDAGYKAEQIDKVPQLKIKQPKKKPDTILIDGTRAISLGAVQAGVRNYYMYPMSPTSGILSYLAEKYHDTGMLVKQAEDEITAVQMTIGSMHAGSRALVATSGGGYDLMTESISLSGLTETPLVVIIGQRPGPATGLPTWTSQGDLNLAINAGHGEFPRVVIACSDPTSSYELIQHAFNIAEEYQSTVIVLTSKSVLETFQTVDTFKQGKIPIKRGLVTKKSELEKLKSEDRYKITKSGVSKRWIPGSCKAYYYANGDEHWVDGKITEDSKPVSEMYEKRMRKEITIKKSLPDPVIYGPKKDADISFIGWGGTKNVMLDIIEYEKENDIKVNYLHFDYIWPLRDKVLNKFFVDNKNVCLIEGNYRGQLGDLVEKATCKKFKGKLLKYDGRPFFFEEVHKYVKRNAKTSKK